MLDLLIKLLILEQLLAGSRILWVFIIFILSALFIIHKGGVNEEPISKSHSIELENKDIINSTQKPEYQPDTQSRNDSHLDYLISPMHDCSVFKPGFETLICSNQELMAHDARLNEIYQTARQINPDSNYLFEQHIKWIDSAKQCQDEICLLLSYRQRIKEIEMALHE